MCPAPFGGTKHAIGDDPQLEVQNAPGEIPTDDLTFKRESHGGNSRVGSEYEYLRAQLVVVGRKCFL